MVEKDRKSQVDPAESVLCSSLYDYKHMAFADFQILICKNMSYDIVSSWAQWGRG